MEEIKKNPMYGFLLVLVVSATAGLQGWMALFTNFAKEIVGVNGFQIGLSQSVREIPGFLTFLVVYMLLFFKEHRLSSWSVILMGGGIGITGFLTTLDGLLLSTFVMSVGFHYFETTNKSLTIQYFNKQQSAIVFAKLRGYGAVANTIIGVYVWTISGIVSYQTNFLILGVVVVLSGMYMLTQNPLKGDAPKQHNKLVFKKKYWLYYTINFLSGARRQIFIVFAIFLLVEKYKLSVSHVAIIYVINNVVTYFANPLISKAINNYGERVVLSLESASLFILFLGYAFIDNVWITIVLYIIDSLFFNFSIGINTFLQKIAEPKDISPSTAVGFTINHIAAVVIPVIGGTLWLINRQLPFIIGALLTLLNLYFIQKITAQVEKVSLVKVSNKD